MTATHVALIECNSYLLRVDGPELRDNITLCSPVLSRTFCTQVETLKKYRAKASQTVRVERVEVREGGQAIVGDITHNAGAE
jgi:hypothetical protein